LQQQRHPSDLEIEADECPHIGISELQNEARLRFDEVRILIAFADVRRGDFVPADRFRNVVEVGGARDDLELRRRLVPRLRLRVQW